VIGNRLIGVWASLILVLIPFLLASQNYDSVKVVRTFVAQGNGKLYRHFNDEEFKYLDLVDLKAEIKIQAYKHGFLNYSISEQAAQDTLLLHIDFGSIYKWNSIRVSDETSRVLRKAGVNADRMQRKPISPKRIGNALNAALDELENNGFPFASLRLDSVLIEDSTLDAFIVLEKGPFTLIDSVILIGNLNIRESYITNYLNIKEGTPYSEKQIRAISSKLSEVPFLTEVQPAQIRFQPEKTKITLALNAKRASVFDGIIGFLPDKQTGEILITGDVSLHLENALKNGEVINVNWRKLKTNTQDLYAEAIAPFVLNSPISPDGALKIYRRDTLFTDVFTQLGVRYVFSRANYVRLFVDRQTTSLISTKQYENTFVIPQYLDRSIVSYGLGFNFRKLDYLLNPAKGTEFFIEAAAGNKVILRNQALPEFIYDSLNLTSLQVKSRINAAYYLTLLPRLIFHQRFIGAALVNDQLFNNEAYRIGGLKTLRGFNEESINASTYAIGRSELRYQIERNGYVFLLFDQARYENSSLNKFGAKRDTPKSIGVGITLGTKAGIFSLASAIGSEQGNPFLLRAAKFHFGFLSVF
jgi:outer membrane protein assembly factor BamA